MNSGCPVIKKELKWYEHEVIASLIIILLFFMSISLAILLKSPIPLLGIILMLLYGGSVSKTPSHNFEKISEKSIKINSYATAKFTEFKCKHCGVEFTKQTGWEK